MANVAQSTNSRDLITMDSAGADSVEGRVVGEDSGRNAFAVATLSGRVV
ncbi:hypothetical protein [Rhodococcus opacus]|nr:hypothetical protein [Rhodococcus opacus]